MLSLLKEDPRTRLTRWNLVNLITQADPKECRGGVAGVGGGTQERNYGVLYAGRGSDVGGTQVSELPTLTF